MMYFQQRPAPPLSSFIEALWYIKAYQVPHTRERVLPSGAMQVVINLACDGFRDGSGEAANDNAGHMPPSLIVGVHSKYIVIDTVDLVEVIGVQFRPGGAAPFVSVPADEFQNAQVSLEALWNREARDLRERLLEAPSPQAKLRTLEAVLLARARNRLARHPAVDFAIGQFQSSAPACSVEDVAAQIGISRRHFAQVFREQVGVTPKLYCRIRRFQTAMRQISLGREMNWTELALSCGYFDQSHFVNDFRAFSGINPTAYVAKRSQWMNHVALES